MKRSEMMEDCPEEFEDRLKDIIDHIETKVTEVRAELDIKDIKHMSNIEDAYDMISELSDDLY